MGILDPAKVTRTAHQAAGSVAGLIYNASWLDYAISNEGCWLIFINWFLACMGIWLFAGYTITNRFLKR